MDGHDPMRRTVLRGVLATGCALGVPMLSGCKGEQAQEAGTATADPPVTAGGSAEPAAPGKVSQQAAGYQDTPNGEERCGNCLHFVAESSTCKVVEGQVIPEGWCTLWARQA